MGMYTMFRFTGLLKEEFVKDIENLNKEPYTWEEFANKHDFARNFSKLDRANMIPFGGMSAYNEDKNPQEFSSIVHGVDPDDFMVWRSTWTFCCDLKDYSQEINTFIREIAPNICDKYIAIKWYEEMSFPVVYEYGNGGGE